MLPHSDCRSKYDVNVLVRNTYYVCSLEGDFSGLADSQAPIPRADGKCKVNCEASSAACKTVDVAQGKWISAGLRFPTVFPTAGGAVSLPLHCEIMTGNRMHWFWKPDRFVSCSCCGCDWRRRTFGNGARCVCGVRVHFHCIASWRQMSCTFRPIVSCSRS